MASILIEKRSELMMLNLPPTFIDFFDDSFCLSLFDRFMNLALESTKSSSIAAATYEVVVLVFLMHLILPRVKILLTLNTHQHMV